MRTTVEKTMKSEPSSAEVGGGFCLLIGFIILAGAAVGAWGIGLILVLFGGWSIHVGSKERRSKKAANDSKLH